MNLIRDIRLRQIEIGRAQERAPSRSSSKLKIAQETAGLQYLLLDHTNLFLRQALLVPYYGCI